MAKYFKVKTNYLKTDTSNENGVSKVSEIRLFEALDYIDAQERAMNLINQNGFCGGDNDIDIQKVSYDSILYRGPEGSFQLKSLKENHQDLMSAKDSEELVEETYWYEIRITRVIEDDKGNEKYIVTKYLVEGQDLEDSIEVMRSYLKDEDEDYWWFSSVQETPIQEVILSDIAIQ